ncbi:MAG: pyruvate dehydrogenase complex dihydrolipoamide acetyltransferase [Turneriella sp.]
MAKLAAITQLSPTMKEGLLVEWLKQEGDSVKPGDPIASIETDKAVMELEAFDGGTLLKHLAAKGARLPVGAPVAVIGKPGEDFSALLASAAPPSVSGAQAPPGPAESATVPLPEPTAGQGIPAASQALTPNRIKASPLAKKIAQQNSIDLRQVTGSGPGGRIVSRDLQQAAASTQKAGRQSIVIPAAHGQRAPDTRQMLTPMRQTIAERLTYSKQHVPHFYLSRTVNITQLNCLRAETNAGLAALHAKDNAENAYLPKKISVNDYIIAAVAQSLSRHPEILRQYVSGDQSKGRNEPDYLLQLGNVDVAFAVSLDDGLITPVIRNAEQHSLFAIAQASQDLATRARARKLLPEEYTGAGFTISNLGMLGISSFQAIINAPEAAILAVGASERRPYEDEKGGVRFGDFLTLNLACDHRVIDGATGAQFLDTLARYLENPGLIR